MSEYTICGVLIHAQQQHLEQIKQLLISQQGVEVHAVSEDGRLVVTVEDASRKQVADKIMKFHELQGVLSAAMIYQFSDEHSENNELTKSKSGEERMSA